MCLFWHACLGSPGHTVWKGEGLVQGQLVPAMPAVEGEVWGVFQQRKENEDQRTQTGCPHCGGSQRPARRL